MSSEPRDIKQKLAAEQDAIAIMSDNVEQVYAQNRLTWWVKALKGEKGSAEEFDKATRKLADYRNQKAALDDLASAPEWFLNSRKAAEWMLQQGYLAKQGGGLLTLDAARKFVDTLRKDKARGFHIDIVRRAADNKYGCPTKIEETKESSPLGIQLQEAILRKNVADANKKEMEVTEMQRELDEKWIAREESEEREAVLIGLLKDCFRHRIYLDSAQLMHSSGVSPGKEAEFTHHVQLFVNSAFNDFSRISSIDLEIEEDDE